jgi:myo-inositol-1(or 4)-monophosphatase
MQPVLDDLITWARAAGQILLDGLGGDIAIRHKGRVDLVTEMDHRSEDYILGQIRARFPEHEILSEESGLLDGHADHTWLVDPLDGTTNYAHGFPIFCVSIAYAHRGELTLGAVYDPSRDELFTAERGRGAYLNGRPIHVSEHAELVDALLVTGFPYDTEGIRNNVGLFARFATRAQSLRRLGSAALDLCYVACGRLDGYWETRIGAWDLAAGALIAQEAGARITTLTGDPHFMARPYATVTANPALHAKMLAVMAEGLPPAEQG